MEKVIDYITDSRWYLKSFLSDMSTALITNLNALNIFVFIKTVTEMLNFKL